MIANKVVVVAALAALTEQALAFNSHRHLHQQRDKRAMETDWVTVWDTVIVTPGAPSQAAPTVADVPSSAPTTTTTTATSTSTTTATVVVPTTTTTPPPPPPQTTTSHTTMVTAVKQPLGVVNAGVEVSISSISTPDAVTTPIAPPPPSTTAVAAPTTAAAAPPPPATSAASGSSSGSGSGSSPGSVGFSSKRGLAYNDATLANFFATACPSCSWGYNWGSSSSGLESSINYVPMLWGPTSGFTDGWKSDADSAIADGAKAMFSFNECDNAGQCNMDPVSAAAAHAQWMNPYAGKALIGAPSITNSGSADQGLDWLSQFFTACKAQEGGCQVDFCNLHWYAEADATDYLFSHLEDAHKVCGDLPIWLTEFAPTDASEEGVSGFLSTVLPKLDSLSYLDAYSYFMVAADNLLSAESVLSTFGHLYAN